jgi:hypothetical protein
VVTATDIREWARENKVSARDVRVWAREQEFDVGVRGQLAPAIWQAYAGSRGLVIDAVPDDKVKNLATGRCRCGRQWSGLAECHCTVCHCHFSRVTQFDMHRVNDTCVDPLTITDKNGEPKIKVRDSVWGVLYVGAGDPPAYWNTGKDEGLYDDSLS